MAKTLDTVIDAVRAQPEATQEVVGRFIRESIAGEAVTLEEIERQYRDERTRQALNEVERGEYISLDEARERMTEFLNR